MINITNKGKVRINWKVSPYDYSSDKANEIQVAFAKKYGIPSANVKVAPDFILPKIGSGSGIMAQATSDDIQDPVFHRKLFLEYLKLNNIKDYDMDVIDEIDKDINSKIDYQSYEKYKRFSIKWVRWSNFQSYGPDNNFDFTTLDGLVLLNGEPANQSGKTTFAVDLLHFLLFGKSEKWDKLEELFNYTIPEATEMFVEGGLVIDGEEYVIKRTLTRPQLSKRTAKSKTIHKVEYYRVVGDSMESLEDYVDENGEDSRQTNKIIKESIGNENDFDLMMCITGSNLDALIDEKPTERGRMFSRWIGLLPLEQKDVLARDKFNHAVNPSLISNKYNRETLKEEIAAYLVEIEECKKKVSSYDKTSKTLEKEINSLEETKKTLLLQKQTIDADILKIDITTLRQTLTNKKNEGVQNKHKIGEITKQIGELGEVDFSAEEYDRLTESRTKMLVDRENMRSEATRLQTLIKQLKTSEFCPTCGKKLDNVDNTKQIAENQTVLDKLIADGKKKNKEIEVVEQKIQSQKDIREKYIQLNKINTQKAAIEVANEKLRAECLELIAKEKEYTKNAEAIDKNNSLDISIRNLDININTKRKERDTNIENSTQNKANIKEYEKEVKTREDLLSTIEKEDKLVYNWKLYLEMVGKNGISKMVLRNVLPIINARIAQVLEDVCDFDVTVEINNRNEVTFNLLRGGIAKDLGSGSGFERTAAALALRTVLADISTISRMNFLVLDEILGRVASENYDNMKYLYDRIARNYDFVFHITHIEGIKDWHNHVITVTKTANGISMLRKSNILAKPAQKTGNKQIKKEKKKR